jgi:hypothetical protein
LPFVSDQLQKRLTAVLERGVAESLLRERREWS